MSLVTNSDGSRPGSAKRALHRTTYSSQLVHATAVLLQGTTFAVGGRELYEEIQYLLSSIYSEDMSQIAGREGKAYLGSLSKEDAEALIVQAKQYAHRSLSAFREQMIVLYGNLYEAFRVLAGDEGGHDLASKEFLQNANQIEADGFDDDEHHHHHEPGDIRRSSSAAMIKRGSSSFSLASQRSFTESLAARSEMKALNIFQLLTGSMVPWATLPLHTFIMKLTGLHIDTLVQFRQLAIARYKDLRKMFDTTGTISAEPFVKEYVEMYKMGFGDDGGRKSEIEEEARLLFEACDSSIDGGLDFDEVSTALATVAPPASVEQFRIRLLMHWGSWKNAFNKLERLDGNKVYPADMMKLGSGIDINPTDVMTLFNDMDIDGSGDLEWEEFAVRIVDTGHFSLAELALRVWMGKGPSGNLETMIDRLEQSLAKMGGGGDRTMPLETFAQHVFGVSLSTSAVWEWRHGRKTAVVGLQRSKSQFQAKVSQTSQAPVGQKSVAQKAVHQDLRLPASPPLAESEVLNVYENLKHKYGHVSLTRLRTELFSGQISDVLALNGNRFAPGEMATVKYRIPRELEAQLLDKPFVAAVPAEMCWSSGGGGAWFIGRQQIFEVPGPKALLINKREGTLQMCIPPMGSQGEMFEFRVFSSPDGGKIGRQVGAAVYFEMSSPAPRQLHICKAELKPTSLKLMWEPPTQMFGDVSSGDLGGYVIHAHPLGGSFEEHLDDDDASGRAVDSTLGWDHVDQKLMQFRGHEIEDLVPGMSYRFHVNAIHNRGFESLEGSSSNAVTVTMPMYLPPSAPGAPGPAGESAAKRGEVTLRWTVPEDDGLAGITSYVLYWDQKPIDEDDGVDGTLAVPHTARGGVEFYPFPGQVYTCLVKPGRKASSAVTFGRTDGPETVECKFRIPPDFSGTHGRFCCAAINAAGEGPVGPMSERLEISDKHGRELWDALEGADPAAIDLLNKALVHFGGLEDLLAAMGEAGLIPKDLQPGEAEEQKRQLGMKQALAMKLDEAGGVEAVLKALNGVDMSNFSEDMAILRMMQQIPNASPGDWADLLDLVKQAGGVAAVVAALRDVNVADIVAAKDAGLLDNSQPAGTAAKVLEAFKAAGGVAGFAQSMEEHKVSIEQIQKNLKTVALMSSPMNPEAWCQVTEKIIAAGGPESVGALLEYLQGAGNALLAAAAGVDPALMVEAIELLKNAGLLDSRESLELLRLFNQIPGGPQQLLKAFSQIHPQCLGPGLKLLFAAGLNNPSCLEAELGGMSEMDCWQKLATRTGKDWGGIRAVLDRLEGGDAEGKNMGSRKMTQKTQEFLDVVDRCGGTEVVQSFIADIAVRGGIKQFMHNLGDFDLSHVMNVLQLLKRYGYDHPDGLDQLNTILQMVAAAGGATQFLQALEHVDMQKFTELIKFAQGAHSLTSSELFDEHTPHEDIMKKCLAVLERVLSECELEHFLTMLKEVNIDQLLALVPYLLNAGFLSRRDRYGNVSQASSSAEALLRWILSAGGVDQVIFAVSRINGRSFPKCMEVIRAAELGQKESKQLTDDFIAWLRGIKGEGGLERLIAASSGLNLISLVQLVQTLAGNGRIGKRIDDEHQRTEYDEKAHKGQCSIGVLSDFIMHAGGLEQFMEQMFKMNAHNFPFIVDLVEKAGLGHFEGSASHHFQPWMDLVKLVDQEGGPKQILLKCRDLDLENFNQCIALLRTAGILHHRWHSTIPKPKTEEDESLALRIEQWCQVVKLIKGNGGPQHFLTNFDGVDIEDLLTSVGLLREAGLVVASEGDSNDQDVQSQGGENPFERGKRSKNEQLREFSKKVKDSGGFDTFWWGLKRVELSELAQDLHCCDVMKRKLCEHARDEDYAWELLRNPQRFDDLFSQLTDAQRGSKEELSYKDRALIAERLRAVGGVDNFLRLYSGLDLRAAADHEHILKREHVPSTDILKKLVGLWPLLKQDAMHLDGALGVVLTLVRWIEKYMDKDPTRMWSWLNQQIAWLLTAIGENNVMMQTMNIAQSSGDSELTPAKLAQFLQTLRPIGGVQGFLHAFKGLDIATASTQARLLYEVNIRDLKTTRLLTSIYQFLGADTKQLKGLEHFVKHFGKDFMARAQDMLGDVERWHRLTDGLVQVARNPGMVSAEGLDLPASASGAQRVLDMLKFAWGLEEAAGPDVGPAEWSALRHELRMCRLQGVLARLRSEVRPKMAATWTLPKATESLTQCCGTCGALLQANYRIARARSATKARSATDLSAYSENSSCGKAFACRPLSATCGSRPPGNHNSPVRLAPVK